MPIKRMYEQLRALWLSRDQDHPFVKGILLTRDVLNGSNVSNSCNQLTERWFTLLGHSLFYCKSSASAEFSGALLTDLFSPVIARVDEKTVGAFDLPEAHRVSCKTVFTLY